MTNRKNKKQKTNVFTINRKTKNKRFLKREKSRTRIYEYCPQLSSCTAKPLAYITFLGIVNSC